MFVPTLLGHLSNLHSKFMCHKANDAKDDKSGKEAGQTVTYGHHQRVPTNKNMTMKPSSTTCYT